MPFKKRKICITPLTVYHLTVFMMVSLGFRHVADSSRRLLISAYNGSVYVWRILVYLFYSRSFASTRKGSVFSQLKVWHTIFSGINLGFFT